MIWLAIGYVVIGALWGILLAPQHDRAEWFAKSLLLWPVSAAGAILLIGGFTLELWRGK
jgi:hypothetical protein